MDPVARDEIVRLGDLEIWEFANLEGGGGGMGMGMMNMEMPHPIAFMACNFKYSAASLHRQPNVSGLSGGFVDDGWKDTVLIMPGKRFRYSPV